MRERIRFVTRTARKLISRKLSIKCWEALLWCQGAVNPLVGPLVFFHETFWNRKFFQSGIMKSFSKSFGVFFFYLTVVLGKRECSENLIGGWTVRVSWLQSAEFPRTFASQEKSFWGRYLLLPWGSFALGHDDLESGRIGNGPAKPRGSLVNLADLRKDWKSRGKQLLTIWPCSVNQFVRFYLNVYSILVFFSDTLPPKNEC